MITINFPWLYSGFPGFLESPEINFPLFQGPGKSWKTDNEVLESPGNRKFKICHYVLCSTIVIIVEHNVKLIAKSNALRRDAKGKGKTLMAVDQQLELELLELQNLQ